MIGAMPIFLFIALTTLAVFLTLTRARPVWAHPTRGRNLLFGLLTVLVPFSVIVLAAWALFQSLYLPYGTSFLSDVVFAGRNASSIILGLVFGVCVGLLLNLMAQGSPYRDLTKNEKGLLVVLPIVLLLGIGGEHLLQDAARRISKISFGGAEVAFIEPAKRQAGRETSSPPPSLFTSSTLNSQSLPIDIFARLTDFISRDAGYVRTAYHLDDPKPELSDSNRKTVQNLIDQLKSASEFTQIIFWPVGKCLVTVFNQSGDISFVRDTLQPLLPPFTEITLPKYSDAERFAQGTDKALQSVFAKLFRYVYERVYRHTDRNGLSKRTLSDLEALEHNCLPVNYLICSQDTWADKNKKIKEFKEWLPIDDPEKTEPLRKAAGELQRILKPCYDQTYREKKPPQWVDQKDVHDYLVKFANEKASLERPYMHILIATIFAQSKQDDTALVYLENWLTENQEWATINPTLKTASDWLQVRTLSVATLLVDNRLGREPSAASLVLREYLIERFRRSLSLSEELFDYKNVVSKLRRGSGDEALENIAFSATPEESSDCPTGVHRPLFPWYVFASVRLADNQLQSPRYLTHHAPDVNRTVRVLLDLRLGCATGLSSLLRAETLRLYAQMQLQDATAMRSVLDKTALEVRLRRAARAADLGLHVIKGLAEDKIAEKLPRTSVPVTTIPILERLAPVDEVTSYEGLLGIRSRLQDAIENLDR
jgi:hypothetical protein